MSGPKPDDLSGQRFGRLVAVAFVPGRITPLPRRRASWQCRCDCGTDTTVQAAALSRGATRSCGCLAKEASSARFTTHGASWPVMTTEYRIWRNIKTRCLDANHGAWKHYGGRGITLCDRWRDSFEAFLADVGHRPSKAHTLDRIANDGHYEPGNVRWALGEVQHGNTRSNVMLTFNGKTQHISAWARELGVPRDRLQSRLRLGWSAHRTLSTTLRGS